jgi:two-component sensor histidine kinase/DNA-binding response OmpR family regulator
MIDKVNILLVDDQPAKLLSYEAILDELGENLVKASSAREALESLLKMEIAVILVDVCMPELDGFQLAAMIRDHPRFQKTAIIFISAIHFTDMDFLRGYEMGAVDYVPVPVVPQVLRAKVKVFAELYRKTRQLEKLNTELETRVAERTAQLEASTRRLLDSEQLRSLALAAGQMGTWNWDAVSGEIEWDEGEYRIFGVDPRTFQPSPESIRALIYPEDWDRLAAVLARVDDDTQSFQTEFRVQRPNGELRWCIGTAVAQLDADKRILHVSGVTTDVTERKEAEERQNLLAREVDHRARNALAVVQSIVRLSRESSVESYVAAVEGRIDALARAHMLLSEFRWQGAHLARLVKEELAPYQADESEKVVVAGPDVLLAPSSAQTLALALHELATNAAKHGALSLPSGGRISFTWELQPSSLVLQWIETGGPPVRPPESQGYGTRIIAASVERQLGGHVVFDWRPEGLKCTLSIPRREKTEMAERVAAGRRSSEREQVRQLAAFAGNRILIAEDEALVAMMMGDVLADLGFCVVGPIGTAGEALDAASRGQVDAAILDVNLGGELIYPVADALAARGVPFAFVTGYGVESIDNRFAHVPVLQKPIAPRVLGDLFSAAANGKMNGRHDVALDNFVRTGTGARTSLY